VLFEINPFEYHRDELDSDGLIWYAKSGIILTTD
jgi:hypothetical protein